MSITSDTNAFPFNNLSNEDFREVISNLSVNLDEHKTHKLRNMIFNPFPTNNRRKTFLTLNPELDPDYNYYVKLASYVDECDYRQEDSFNKLTANINNMNISTLHLNIRSITNKYDDLQAYPGSLKHTFSVTGLSETWLNKKMIIIIL